MKRPFVALSIVVGVALVLVAALALIRDLSGFRNPTGLSRAGTATPDLSGLPNLTGLPTQASTPIPTEPPRPTPTPTRSIVEWEWVKPGFSGGDAITLTNGIERYVYYSWSPSCDAPERHQLPMIWGKHTFYTDTTALARLFDGPCNDGRPLLFLNEPAKVEQANITPVEAAAMFYTMTRGTDWQYERWHGPIYAGNNVVEERQWDAAFVAEFARLNDGKTAIPEIAGWGIHLYGNYEYGPQRGDPNVVWTKDIPPGEIRNVVYRSMRQLDGYLTDRRVEGNATALAVTEFGLLQASQWHTPRTYYYETTARFMEEYVRQFDRRPEIQAWFWFISIGSQDEFLDTDLMVDRQGALTPNGIRWRELTHARR